LSKIILRSKSSNIIYDSGRVWDTILPYFYSV
jgi:hypothetical protein